MAQKGSQERERKIKKLVHIDRLINSSVQGCVHIHTRHIHTHSFTQRNVLTYRLTSLSSLNAAQSEDVLLVGEELPHLMEGLLPPDG